MAKKEVSDPAGGPCFVSWRLSNRCTFRCRYCFSHSNPDVAPFDQFAIHKHSPEYIANCFNSSGKVWLVQLTGGEPFLYQQIIDLCKLLTDFHYIQIDTNFSTGNLVEFADSIDPSRVKRIDAAYHIEERAKWTDGIAGFVNNVKYFQDKGYRVRVEYVLHPILFQRFEDDVEYLTQSGCKEVNLKVFVGYYKNRYYPGALDEGQKAFMRKQMDDPYEVDIMNGTTKSCFGHKCYAGVNSFVMDEVGALKRCVTSRSPYGNFFSGDPVFDEEPKACAYDRCNCPYEGLRSLTGERANTMEILKELRKELPFRLRRITTRRLVRYFGRRLSA